MDGIFKLKTENPQRDASFFSRLYFCWLIPIIKKGSKQNLSVYDLYKIKDKDQSKLITDKFEKNWRLEVIRAKEKNMKPSLLKVILKTFRGELIAFGLLWFYTFAILLCARPLVLNQLIWMFTNTTDIDNSTEMYIWSTVLILISLLTAFCMHHGNYELQSTGMRIRIALSSLIYRKVTRLNQKALGEITTGQVINLLSNDLIRFDLVMPSVHVLWGMPFQVIILFLICWKQVGISSVVGLLSMIIITVPIQGILIVFVGKLRANISRKSDYRIKLMSEIVTGIQVIKMYGWEKPFEKLIEAARAAEIKSITTASYLRGVYIGCSLFTQRLALFATLICFVLLGNNVSADKVFPLAQSYSTLQLVMAVLFSLSLNMVAETWVSIKRVQQFLCLEEKEEVLEVEETQTRSIILRKVSASWTSTGETLQDVHLIVPPGALCVVVGAVGSGKSSLLQLILGELPLKSGIKQISGNISYCSQEPWLFQSTIRKNILFGRKYDKIWYEKVVNLCALERDFQQFPRGDETIVGEKGVSISGGQRARINLARTIYRCADIYLLDDPLSGVDTYVGNHIFEECIYNHLKGKTRILVTHQLQFLKKADIIVVFEQGRIVSQGTFEEISTQESYFQTLLVEEHKTEKTLTNFESDVSELTASTISMKSNLSSIEQLHETDDQEKDEMEESGGDPNAKPFKNYILATKNLPMVFVFFLLLLLLQFSLISIDNWVTFWTLEEEIRNSSDTTVQYSSDQAKNIPTNTHKNDSTIKHNISMYNNIFDNVYVQGVSRSLIKTKVFMYIYGGLMLICIILTFLCTYLLFKMSMLSSTNLHSRIFHKLLKAPMRFFDINSSGRILNRLSKDMGAIDEVLPKTLLDVILILIVITGVVINITISNPYMIVAFIIVSIIFLKYKSYYILSAKNLKHLEGKTKSPVFSHIASTINGLTTIRALKAESLLINEFDQQQDVHTSAWNLTIACMNFFSLMLDTICIAFLACVTFSFVIINRFFRVNGSTVGLAISQGMILIGMLQFGMRQISEAINYSTSIERILHYTKLDNEGAFDTPKENAPKGTWPKKGMIEFRNLSMRYIKTEAPILKKLNFSLMPGEKIGIVGRTGAGKSSLISALFRLAPLEGAIFIDEVDTRQLGLTDLRKKISIIPQEPVLFSDTIRYNLDPFNEFDDDKIWDALEQVELKDNIESLDALVTEGGGNFSLGQRQLMCLARAILKSNKILVMDEATANVDHKTDALVQETIRKLFKDCTVLTIAHRLNTIMDTDKVLVMSFGNMVEFGEPYKLLQISDGYFHNMVLEMGSTMYTELKNIAKITYDKKMDLEKEKK